MAADPKTILRLVGAMLSSGGNVVASLAPTFVANWELAQPGQMVTALRQLGFGAVEETAVAVDRTIAARVELLQRCDQPLISSSCPVVVGLIRQQFPTLAERISPMPSPMVLHARMLREKYGPAVRVVFIGPCEAKRLEAEEVSGGPDLVLLFTELEQMLAVARLVPATLPGVDLNPAASRAARLGVLLSTVSGWDNCVAYLSQVQGGKGEVKFAELLACPGGCLGSPGMSCDLSYELRRQRVSRHWLSLS